MLGRVRTSGIGHRIRISDQSADSSSLHVNPSEMLPSSRLFLLVQAKRKGLRMCGML